MDAPRHLGGGWYELTDGRRIRGKAAAVEAQAAVPVGLVGRVEAMVVDLRRAGALSGAGEALAELALELAGRLTEGANAAMAHELREVLDDLEARGHAAQLTPEDATDDDDDDDGDDFDRVVVQLSSALGDAPGS